MSTMSEDLIVCCASLTLLTFYFVRRCFVIFDDRFLFPLNNCIAKTVMSDSLDPSLVPLHRFNRTNGCWFIPELRFWKHITESTTESQTKLFTHKSNTLTQCGSTSPTHTSLTKVSCKDSVKRLDRNSIRFCLFSNHSSYFSF